jgi:RsiW-degrading membrane proteinase PrsW (M82 family)
MVARGTVRTALLYIFVVLVAVVVAGVVNHPFLELGLVGYVVVAPISEEILKSLGVVIVLGKRRTPRSGAEAGLLVGLGFGILETISVYPDTVLVRLFTSIPFHVGTGGIDGYAVGSRRYWLIAGSVGLHSLYNLIALSELGLLLVYEFIFAFLTVACVAAYLLSSAKAAAPAQMFDAAGSVRPK